MGRWCHFLPFEHATLLVHIIYYIISRSLGRSWDASLPKARNLACCAPFVRNMDRWTKHVGRMDSTQRQLDRVKFQTLFPLLCAKKVFLQYSRPTRQQLFIATYFSSRVVLAATSPPLVVIIAPFSNSSHQVFDIYYGTGQGKYGRKKKKETCSSLETLVYIPGRVWKLFTVKPIWSNWPLSTFVMV